MVTAICKAKDPRTCSYHGAVITMNEAQAAGDFETYFTARKIVEDKETSGWEEEELKARINVIPDLANLMSNTSSHVNKIEDVTHILSTDPRVQNGEVFDSIRVVDTSYSDNDGGTFYRSTDNNIPNEPYQIRIQLNKKLTSEDIEKFASALGYAYRVHIRGESLGWPKQDTPYSFIVSADTTKSSRSDLVTSLKELEKGYSNIITTGSPDVTPGGKQRITPVDPDNKVKINFYYDSVTEED